MKVNVEKVITLNIKPNGDDLADMLNVLSNVRKVFSLIDEDVDLVNVVTGEVLTKSDFNSAINVLENLITTPHFEVKQ